MDYLVTVKAENLETGEPKRFSSTLSQVGELLNDIVLSGYHNISDMKVSDI